MVTTAGSYSPAASAAAGSSQHSWEEGEIAFLRAATNFSAADRASLIKGSAGKKKGCLPVGATGHPVIILQRSGAEVLITTVSSYGWTHRQLPPWQQACHKGKARDDFRAFAGSERPNGRDVLLLRPGQRFPMAKASWVYAQSAYVVPLSVIGRFDKVKGRVLRMTDESLRDLCAHMETSCPTWRGCQARLSAATTNNVFAPPPKLALFPALLPLSTPPAPCGGAWTSHWANPVAVTYTHRGHHRHCQLGQRGF
ncbi:hypothetical protein N657DRAFT_687612 [Parathielavia appendiculata]|uniref:Uncharacterized protein n=1 Tax=Parathielavia appendiculata TaxID=2587402 RepID=A0AAN6Z7C4_9PEZI|nr:hypothetical protein N657DRAFT_687612 [Parathielavia appendiculata]